MKSFTVAAACLLTLVAATPVEKRALIVHTVIEEVTETVEATTTIWVQATEGAHENYQLPATTSATRHQHHHNHNPKPTTTSTPEVVAPEPVPTTPTTSSSTSTSVYVPPYSPPVVETPVYTPPVVETPVYTPPVVETPVYTPPVVETPVYTPPVVPTTLVPVIPTTVAPIVEPTTQAPAPSPSTPADGGSTGGACGTVGGSCSGDITYYEAGLGACGWTNDGSSEDVFALAHGMMGEQSNGNPFCGRMATIKVPGKPSVTAKLVDKCMGCEGQSIDLSSHLFNQLCDEATGRLHGVEWHFTS